MLLYYIMGGFGQSIDIGKDLEREKKFEEIQRQQEELRNQELKKEEPKPEEPKKEEQKEETTASVEEPPAKEPELRLNKPEPSAEELLQDAEPEEAEEDEPEPSLAKIPDPTEEDIEAIMTKHVPHRKARRTFWGAIVAYRMLIIAIIVLAFSGWLVLHAQQPAQTGAITQETPQPAAPAPVPNVTVLEISEDGAPRVVDVGTPVEAVSSAAASSVNSVSAAPQTAPAPVNNLQNILASGLN